MTQRSTARWKSALITAAMTTALVVPFQAGTAEAAGPKGWRALDMRLSTQTVAAPASEGVAAVAKCPRGTKVIGGGAFFYLGRDKAEILDDVRLAASFPLPTKRGWFANGLQATALPGVRFAVKALCAERIDYTFRTVRSAGLSAGATAGGYLPCEQEETALGGGAYFHSLDRLAIADDAERAAVTSSSVTHDRLAWYAHGYALSNSSNLYMTSVVMCTTTALKTTHLDQRVAENVYQLAAGSARCPDEYKLLTGGSFWANDPGGPSPDEADNAGMSSSYPHRPTVWNAGGENFSLDGGDYVTRAMCLPR